MRFELPVLLAARLGKVVRIVFHVDRHDMMCGIAECTCDIGLERCVAAFMFDDLVAVHPDLGVIIDRPEMQQHAFALGLDVEFALVPACTMEAAIPYPARLGFGRIRHGDVMRPGDGIGRMLELLVVVEGKFPLAVQ